MNITKNLGEKLSCQLAGLGCENLPPKVRDRLLTEAEAAAEVAGSEVIGALTHARIAKAFRAAFLPISGVQGVPPSRGNTRDA
jgi:hypothetical protein